MITSQVKIWIIIDLGFKTPTKNRCWGDDDLTFQRGVDIRGQVDSHTGRVNYLLWL